MLGATLTTAATWQLISASALTRSRSRWSMMAMSPGHSRLVRFLVRRSRRAGPITPGRSSGLPRRVQGMRRDGLFIAFHPARQDDHRRLHWPARRVTPGPPARPDCRTPGLAWTRGRRRPAGRRAHAGVAGWQGWEGDQIAATRTEHPRPDQRWGPPPAGLSRG